MNALVIVHHYCEFYFLTDNNALNVFLCTRHNDDNIISILTSLNIMAMKVSISHAISYLFVGLLNNQFIHTGVMMR